MGTTYIDVEDRWRSQHRATVGIANEYSKYIIFLFIFNIYIYIYIMLVVCISVGYNRWRNSALPTEILNDLCKRHDIDQPHYYDNAIEVDGIRFSDSTKLAINEDIKQRLALTALKKLDQLPSFGYKLMPEHVETRSLYREDVPGIEQVVYYPSIIHLLSNLTISMIH